MEPQSPLTVFNAVECIDDVGLEGNEKYSWPFTRVAGSLVLLQVQDNFGIQSTVTTLQRFWAALEIGIWGRVQGYEYLLQRQHVRMLTGPMVYAFDSDSPYESISIKARNMSGGKAGPPAGQPANLTPSAANGFSLKLQAHVQARSGIGPPPGKPTDTRRAF